MNAAKADEKYEDTAVVQNRLPKKSELESMSADATGPLEAVASVQKGRWSELKGRLRPTQAALGWDWALCKISNLTDAVRELRCCGAGAPREAVFLTPSPPSPPPPQRVQDATQEYMARKPVPCVQRGELLYIIDHHHTRKHTRMLSEPACAPHLCSIRALIDTLLTLLQWSHSKSAVTTLSSRSKL